MSWCLSFCSPVLSVSAEMHGSACGEEPCPISHTKRQYERRRVSTSKLIVFGFAFTCTCAIQPRRAGYRKAKITKIVVTLYTWIQVYRAAYTTADVTKLGGPFFAWTCVIQLCRAACRRQPTWRAKPQNSYRWSTDRAQCRE